MEMKLTTTTADDADDTITQTFVIEEVAFRRGQLVLEGVAGAHGEFNVHIELPKELADSCVIAMHLKPGETVTTA